MKNVLFAAMVIFALSFVTECYAFRCGDELVSTGDSSSVLLARCGRPMNKDFSTKKINGKWESVESWFYNCGEADFIYKLTIIDSKLVSDDTVGRGSGNPTWPNKR
jgi:hypothetical protein